ncbi:MAG TPA: superoxide dismutase family protein [Gemmatimonadaceae bacterium]|jgi:Cu-Zn family superoxide dismutase|nr:superoxide dismutase family protein [Gemmatimonadaceae bacterium]
MRTDTRILALLALPVGAIACTSALTSHPVAAATATLMNASGGPAGSVQLWQEAGGLVHVDVSATNLTTGAHGIHFHAVGRCEGGATAFSTAGGHYNPMNREHGLQNPAGPHAGDAPNLQIGADGSGHFSFTTDRITLTAGSTSLFDSDGSAIVIHSSADDQVSQPSGNSGARVACGVVTAAP